MSRSIWHLASRPSDTGFSIQRGQGTVFNLSDGRDVLKIISILNSNHDQYPRVISAWEELVEQWAASGKLDGAVEWRMSNKSDLYISQAEACEVFVCEVAIGKWNATREEMKEAMDIVLSMKGR